MSKKLKKLFPKELRGLVTALPLAGAAAEAAGLIQAGKTLKTLRHLAGGLTAAGAITQAAIVVAEQLSETEFTVEIDLDRLLGE